MNEILAKKQILLIGAGQMGRALVKGWLHAGIVQPLQILVAEPHETNAKHMSALGVSVGKSAQPMLTQADIIIFATKPAQTKELAQQWQADLADKLIISIAAGVNLTTLNKLAPAGRWVRIMPNQPIEVGAAMSGGAYSRSVTAQDRTITETLFSAVGKFVWLDKESWLHAVTALSGSGPGFIANIIEVFEDAGVLLGLPRELAQLLILETIQGTIKQLQQTGIDAHTLKQRVTSPGGTTIAGLRAFEAAGGRQAITAQLEAAYEKSIALAQEDSSK